MSGRRAYATVRAYALRGRLLGPRGADRLRAARGPRALAGALADAGRGERLDHVFEAGLERLAADAAALIAAAPARGRPLLGALVGLHEVENVKLLRRAARRGLEPAAWRDGWRPLGRLATLPLERCLEVRSPASLATALARTPWAALPAVTADDADPDDEARVDRWASLRIATEARRLASREPVAASLALRVVRARDVESLRRATPFAVRPEHAAARTAILGDEIGREACRAIAAWTAEDGPLGRRLPRGLVPQGERIADWPALADAVARERRGACRRAFLGSPFAFAPVVAAWLLCDEEWRAIVALSETAGEPGWDEVVDRRLAASAMGA